MLEILGFVLVGFLAQLVDGALGMAYGVTATTVLLLLGTPPQVASASVHAAETFTTGASALSHWRLGNVEGRLMVRLAVPGVIGGFAGAYLLASFPGQVLRPVVGLYLLAMGVLILIRAFRGVAGSIDLKTHPVTFLGLVGGFLDAVGGGGWGPIVASRMMSSGGEPRFVIGSVNCAEFFLTLTISVTFFATIGLKLWPVIAGLIVGGVFAAPLGALCAAKVSAKPLLILVGCLVAILSLTTFVITVRTFF